jgi:hypothetical protein
MSSTEAAFVGLLAGAILLATAAADVAHEILLTLLWR